ncbi:hypothetical protein [Cronobacter sakazakii]|uniref:hypothetical protein n=1 Tax=Cronobacter sakazakii TaxID=28141 RepID=UPI00105496D6|nr:hypothetical protein [Cronobacter sakazakii]MCI0324443.1 hypothetical protein [Cronobacter sakazakii]
MKKYFYGLSFAFGMIAFSACATDIYQCGYARADVTNGVMEPMTASLPSRVEVSGDSFKAYRPDGSFIFSPPVTKKQGPAIVADDGASVYAIANDRSSFAVSDRIKKYTEQWADCHQMTAENKENDGIKGNLNPKYRPLSPNEKKAIEEAISNQLKDPYSAKFKHSQYVYNGNGEYCAYVNSKNSYGGYVGDMPFLVMLVGSGKKINAAVISFANDEAEISATYEICKKLGYFE